MSRGDQARKYYDRVKREPKHLEGKRGDKGEFKAVQPKNTFG